MQPHLSAYVARQSDILVTVPEAVSSEQASLAQLSQLGLEFRRNENSFGAKSHAMNAGFSKSGENGL